MTEFKVILIEGVGVKCQGSERAGVTGIQGDGSSEEVNE